MLPRPIHVYPEQAEWPRLDYETYRMAMVARVQPGVIEIKKERMFTANIRSFVLIGPWSGHIPV